MRLRYNPLRSVLVRACLGLALASAGVSPLRADDQAPPTGGITAVPPGEITQENVGRLKLVFSFRTGSPHGHAGSPQFASDTLFLLTPFPHTLFALDLSRPASPVKWQYEPKANGMAEGLACCDTVNAGPTVSGDRVYFNTLDGHTIALDAGSGQVAWDVTTASLDAGETLGSAPLVAKDKVFVGNSGDEYGARGWIAALDQATGRELWRKFSTGPDADVGIGPEFQPYHAKRPRPRPGPGNLGILGMGARRGQRVGTHPVRPGTRPHPAWNGASGAMEPGSASGR